MRILVDCSNYFLNNQNYGDLAMYVMTSRRLKRCWPSAEINWITLDAPMIERHVPGVRPWVLKRRHHWQVFRPEMCQPLQPMQRWRRPIRRLQSREAIRASETDWQAFAVDEPDVEQFLQEYRRSDLVVATGGGYFSDNFSEHAIGILDTLAGGRCFGLPSVILGAGFETVTNPRLRQQAAAILPQLDLIACREGDGSPAVLREFGVSPDRIRVVGDEALELAFQARAPGPGDGIGVNLRKARYSGVTDEVIPVLREVLARVSREKDSPLLPIPISMFGPSDCDSIRQLLAEQGPASSGGEELDSLPKLFGQLNRCRIVVTGSYHAAVFALGQGLSVVGLVQSLHYAEKMGGLARQFGRGCELVRLDEPDLAGRLGAAIDEAWGSAAANRPRLLATAAKLIRKNGRMYRDLKRLVPLRLAAKFAW